MALLVFGGFFQLRVGVLGDSGTPARRDLEIGACARI